jgi:predicted amidohydrolase/GNAT superfamily N-acetyltransferase
MEKIVEKIELRTLRHDDFEQLNKILAQSYSNWTGAQWEPNQLTNLVEIFPEGQIAVAVNDEIVGCALSIVVRYDDFGDDHTYDEITNNFTFSSHRNDGDVLYGIEVFIHPEYRGMRMGRRLYDARKELCEELNLKAIIFGGRIPNYHEHSDKMKPRTYIQKVRNKEIYDPVLTFQLSNDFHVKKILTGYMPGDKESKEFAVLLQWDNIYYQKISSPLKQNKTFIRLGLVQWQMRTYRSFEELIEQVEFFIDAVSGYKADFILFPEFFNAPLMAEYNHLNVAEAIRELAAYTERIRDQFVDLAVSYNINIITGSMPLIERNKLYNVGYVCRRDGTFERYTKIHPTPDEVKAYGMVGGKTLKTIDTDCGKIGVLICYDVEFPELSRILADQGMDILFVPFLTDTQNGYSRVRHCSQARAIENECYVAIAGSVGNLPKVHNMDIQFGQSVVFTPCDFAFPTDGVKAQATPNTEMILIADLDLDDLKELHEFGSVRNLKDRRTDVYEVKYFGNL